ncbi:MAG: FHA domain-containing protein [Actinomycetales bacterium]|nr:FHA domain-containing protein [Actinomycetales bacterium]
MSTLGTRWWAGDDYGFVWPGGVALLPDTLTPEEVDRVWSALSAGLELGEIIQMLTEILGVSLVSLPHFAVALVDVSAGHVAARGSFEVSVDTGDEVVSISGEAVTTWSERPMPVVRSVDLHRLGSPAQRDGDLPLVGGVVRTARIVRGPSGALAAYPPDTGVVSHAQQREPAQKPWALPEIDEYAGPSATPVPNPAVPPLDVVAAQQPPVHGPPSAADLTSSPGKDSAGGSVPEDGNPAELVDLGAGNSTLMGYDDESDPPESEEPAAESIPVQPSSRYSVMWEDTVAHAVEEAAVRDVAREEESPASDSAPGAERASLTAQAASGEPSGTWSAQPSVEAEFISSVPGRGASSTTAAIAVQTDGLGDHDGETVMGFVVSGAPASLPAESTLASGETVLALVCRAGHASRPHAEVCRVCGISLAGSVPQNVPRPPLGHVRSSTGEVVALTEQIVAGRNPRASRVRGTTLPRLLAMPYPHISSSHLEIRLEGWGVYAVDLDSRNGTYLRRRNEPPVRIPKPPVLLCDGDILDLGHGVRLTFEGLP